MKAVLPDITHRKMMGEYLLYRDGVLFGGIYDDRLLLKITRTSAAILRDCPAAFPYEGGGEMILFPEPYDAPLLQKVVGSMTEELRKPRRHSRNSVLHQAGRSLRSLRESNRGVLSEGFPGHLIGKRRINGPDCLPSEFHGRIIQLELHQAPGKAMERAEF
ncbi:MAG: TfoX/Sxy family protein [Candidatus Methanomethylophilaceae archaeon]|nr:TfoX/Sxy family protein [Candidatus Methanomethylophilaceae archaeon]